MTDSVQLAPPAGGSAVTIGAYDGVHLGHRALLAELRARAQESGLATVVVTFDRHPASVVRPESAPLLLCDLDQKLELLASAGVDRTVVVRFDEERGERDRRGLRRPGPRRGPRRPAGRGGGGLPLRPRPEGQRGAC